MVLKRKEQEVSNTALDGLEEQSCNHDPLLELVLDTGGAASCPASIAPARQSRRFRGIYR